jgi:FkbM family methyltransferase
MDTFWREAAEFARAHSSDMAIVAPIEMNELIHVDFGYSNARTADAPTIGALVLHKGKYRNLNPQFLHKVLHGLKPAFANAVFIVFAKGIESLPTDHEHLGDLATIADWAAADVKTQEEIVKQPPRMAPVYVGDGFVLIETVRRHLMFIPGVDRSLGPHLIRHGCFEPWLMRYIEEALRPGMVFIDVGANVGFFTLVGAAVVGRSGRVIAIEALPKLVPIVRDNLQINGFDYHSSILPFAAAREEGEVTFYEFGRYKGGNTLVPEIAAATCNVLLEETTPIKVKARTLTSMLAETKIAKADLIKIDVEGYEVEVLEGAMQFLRAQSSLHLIVEWQRAFMELHGAGEKLYALLTEELGCSISVITPEGGARPVGFTELAGMEHADIVARRGLDPEPVATSGMTDAIVQSP